MDALAGTDETKLMDPGVPVAGGVVPVPVEVVPPEEVPVLPSGVPPLPLPPHAVTKANNNSDISVVQ